MMTEESYKYIIERIVQNAFDSLEESKKNPKEAYYTAHKLAHYEILDIIKTELFVRDADLKEFGLDIDLEKTFL